jgi:hypothetical protein
VFLFLVFTEVASLKVVHHLKIYHNAKCHTPALTGARFASTSEV